MIIGNGQIAKAFKDSSDLFDFIIFASGVADSSCINQAEFERERLLLIKQLDSLNGRKIVYFSSCALSAENYQLTPYYEHKQNMESLIKTNTDQYFIFRIPQLFGEIKRHPTLINFLYHSIKEQKEFNLHDGAYRYVLELSDLKKIVLEYVKINKPPLVLDVANTYRYSVLDIVEVLEKSLCVKGTYNLIQFKDSYTLDLSSIDKFVYSSDLDITFGRNYLTNKLAGQSNIHTSISKIN